jgi:glycosyltransferase involved in cell wall biosynthesis
VKLTASLITRNELGRYLKPCVAHLLEFCNEIRVLDDASTDGTYEWLMDQGARVIVLRDPPPERQGKAAFFRHATSRNRLLGFTLEGDPTHILAIDGDELVDDGAALRAACEQRGLDAWKLCLEEVWEAHHDRLEIRQDGAWEEHDVAMLWRPDRLRRSMRIVDRGHATGRVPAEVSRLRTGHACVSLLHFGWTNKAERAERFERYAVGDGGRFHARRHIDSIMWPAERVHLVPREWPAGLAAYKDALLERANSTEGAIA